MYIHYVDSDSAQWVEVVSGSGVQPVSGSGSGGGTYTAGVIWDNHDSTRTEYDESLSVVSGATLALTHDADTEELRSVYIEKSIDGSSVGVVVTPSWAVSALTPETITQQVVINDNLTTATFLAGSSMNDQWTSMNDTNYTGGDPNYYGQGNLNQFFSVHLAEDCFMMSYHDTDIAYSGDNGNKQFDIYVTDSNGQVETSLYDGVFISDTTHTSWVVSSPLLTAGYYRFHIRNDGRVFRTMNGLCFLKAYLSDIPTGETILDDVIDLTSIYSLTQTSLVADNATTSFSYDNGTSWTPFSADHGTLSVPSGSTQGKVKVDITAGGSMSSIGFTKNSAPYWQLESFDDWGVQFTDSTTTTLINNTGANATIRARLTKPTALASTSGTTSGGLSVYLTPLDLPTTGSTGDQAYVESNTSLYIYDENITGWYRVALINQTPTFTSTPDASYSFATDGTPIVVTPVAVDPEGLLVTYSVIGDTGTVATMTQDGNAFTFTPSTDESNAGSFSITFRATDGTNVADAISNFSLELGLTWLQLDQTAMYYDFSTNTISGNTIVNQSPNDDKNGYSSNAIINGNVTWVTDHGGSLKFGGTVSDYVDLGDYDWDGLTDISLVIATTADPQWPGQQSYVIGNYRGNSINGVAVYASGRIGGRPDSTQDWIETNAPLSGLSETTPRVVGLTINNGIIKGYLNGVEVGDTISLAGGAVVTTNNPLILGGAWWYVDQYMTSGNVLSVIYYNKALTAAEHLDISNGLASHHDF
jgi:hypothetical protein